MMPIIKTNKIDSSDSFQHKTGTVESYYMWLKRLR